MSGRRNRTRCRDSVTVQHTPLISPFVLPSSSPTLSTRSLLSHRARGDKYYRDCDIRAIPRVAIYVTRSRDSRLRSRLLGDGDARGGGEGGRVRGSREKQTRRKGRRGEGGEDAHPEATHARPRMGRLLYRSTEFRQRNQSRVRRSAKREKKKRCRLKKIQARNGLSSQIHRDLHICVLYLLCNVSLFVTRFKLKPRCERVYSSKVSRDITFRSRATAIIGARKEQGYRQRRDYASLISNYKIVDDWREDSFDRVISLLILYRCESLDKLFPLLQCDISLEFASSIVCVVCECYLSIWD